MLDPVTKKPMQVSTDGDTGPYLIVVAGEHRDRVEALLREHQVSFSPSPDAAASGDVRLDVLNIREDDVEQVQALLDSAE